MWIELHDTLSEHRKTEALAGALGINQAWAVGILATLWTWALRNAPDGDLRGISDKMLARACFWTRRPALLAQALADCGWLDPDKTIHHWTNYAGRLVAKREANAQRMRALRARTVSAPCGATVPNTTQPDTTQPNPTSPDQTPPHQTDTHTCFPDQAWRTSARARGAVAQRVVDLLELRGCRGGQLFEVVLSYLEVGLEPQAMVDMHDLTDAQLSAALFGLCRAKGLEIRGDA